MINILLVALGCLAQLTNAARLQQFPITLSDQANSLTEYTDGVGKQSAGTCHQVPALKPTKHSKLDKTLDNLYSTESFQLEAYEALGVAIRVPTESFDDLGPVGEDPRWETFKDLHTALESQFPLVYSSLQVTKVNTYGLVFHWQGSNTTLQPVLLTAHQDVVPVEPSTVDQWIQPPFSGHYDGKWIWGRGTCDDKSDLVALFIVIDSLLRQNFKPTRTFVFAYGFDEEVTGLEGAGHLAVYLEKTYGTGGFAALLDEGGGFGEFYGEGVIFAGPSTGEKGYLDVRMEVNVPGGHSSLPPKHTAIGILASAIVQVEAHPHDISLVRTGTAFQEIQCTAQYGLDVPDEIRDLAKRAETDDDALDGLSKAILKLIPYSLALLATTQAVDIIRGGVKVNALPEKADAIINHRIAEDSSVSELRERFTSVVKPIAEKFNITLNAWGHIAYEGGVGDLTLTDAFGISLEPAPVTPTVSSKPWDILAGTIKGALQDSPGYENKKVVVTPTLAIGNTDTHLYWNLTKHIYRYSQFDDADLYNGAHTVNEALRADALINKLRFYTKFMLNWDEADI